MFGPLNGVRVALVTLAVLAALMAAILGYWIVTLVLVVGVALHGFGWLYLAHQAKTGSDESRPTLGNIAADGDTQQASVDP